jgi:hypothetical protein
MPMGNMWAWPSKTLGYSETLAAMKDLTASITRLTPAPQQFGHPIDLQTALLPEYLKAAPPVMPKLCVLVTASPFDGSNATHISERVRGLLYILAQHPTYTVR